MDIKEVWSQPLFGITITMAAYLIAQRIYRRYPKLHPMLSTVAILFLVIWIFQIPYKSYKVGGDIIVLFLGPATVALGVPLYKQAMVIGKNIKAIVVGVVAGSITGFASAALFVTLTHGTRQIMLSMLPKSATTPIAFEIVRQLGGYPELGAVFTAITGLIGSMFGPELLHLCGVRRNVAVGTAVGTAAHGIGTARSLRESELQGSVSGLAMGLNGIITSVLAIPLYWWFG